MNRVGTSRRVGDSGLLVDLPDSRLVHQLVDWVRKQPWSLQLEEIVPGAVTVYFQGDHATLTTVAHDLRTADWDTDTSEAPHRHHELPVQYDGRDLAEVASRTGFSEADVVQAHSSAVYTIDFFGFSPGQAFFSGVPAELRLPRRSVPRTRVPGGSVAVANGYTVIYPRFSPGGWHLIGTYVGEPLWLDDPDQPTRVGVGDTASFVRCDA